MASRTPMVKAAPLDMLLASVPSLPRPILARLAARMIERLDELDGDPDLEDDDPAGGAADDGGELEEWRPEPGFTAPLPIYGIDQRRGFTNRSAAELAWRWYTIGNLPPTQGRDYIAVLGVP